MNERWARQSVLGLIVILWGVFIVSSVVRHERIDPLVWGVPTAAWLVLHTKKEDNK